MNLNRRRALLYKDDMKKIPLIVHYGGSGNQVQGLYCDDFSVLNEVLSLQAYETQANGDRFYRNHTVTNAVNKLLNTYDVIMTGSIKTYAVGVGSSGQSANFYWMPTAAVIQPAGNNFDYSRITFYGNAQINFNKTTITDSGHTYSEWYT